METTAEAEIEISNARIRNSTIMTDGEIKAEMFMQEQNDNECVLVEVSKLSLSDTFMNHTPKDRPEAEFRYELIEVIKSRLEDFYIPKNVKDSKYCFETKSQYVAFLGVQIKMLVDKGCTVDEAWHLVCSISYKELKRVE